jgi:hypothetical protein
MGSVALLHPRGVGTIEGKIEREVLLGKGLIQAL